jgi:ABC-2 type transport system permease protein
MNKTYLIFKHEFSHTLRRPGFLILTLIVPLLALMGIGLFKLADVWSKPQEQTMLGIAFVDHVGIFTQGTRVGNIVLIPYESKEEANDALMQREVTEYIIIPEDYISTGTIQLYTLEKELTTPPATQAILKGFLMGNLLKDKVSPEIVTLLNSPLGMEVTRVSDKGDEALKQMNAANVIIPALFALLLSLALMFGASALISGLGEEKESHLIAVLFSSVSVRQLLMGKIFAQGLAGLLQVLVWLISTPLLLHLASSTFGGFLSNIQIPANFLVLGIIYFILGYLLFAVLSVGVGAISSSSREASQLSLFYILFSFVPLWFSSLLFNFPNASIWVALTIFPVTAPIQAMIRLGFSDIPLWQLLTSIGVLVISIILGLIIAIKIFRIYMLLHGKRPTLKEIRLNLKNA